MTDSNLKELATLFWRKDPIPKKESYASIESLNLKSLKKKILVLSQKIDRSDLKIIHLIIFKV